MVTMWEHSLLTRSQRHQPQREEEEQQDEGDPFGEQSGDLSQARRLQHRCPRQ